MVLFILREWAKICQLETLLFSISVIEWITEFMILELSLNVAATVMYSPNIIDMHTVVVGLCVSVVMGNTLSTLQWLFETRAMDQHKNLFGQQTHHSESIKLLCCVALVLSHCCNDYKVRWWEV